MRERLLLPPLVVTECHQSRQDVALDSYSPFPDVQQRFGCIKMSRVGCFRDKAGSFHKYGNGPCNGGAVTVHL